MKIIKLYMAVTTTTTITIFYLLSKITSYIVQEHLHRREITIITLMRANVISEVL